MRLPHQPTDGRSLKGVQAMSLDDFEARAALR